MNPWRLVREKYRKHRWLRGSLQLIFFLLLYMAISHWQTADYAKGKAPVIVATTLNGRYFDLREHYQKPILVHFWATWCPICKLENGTIESLAKDYKVITIASWSGDAAEVNGFLQQQGLNLPVIVDSDGEWAKLYGVKGVPASFFIKQGRIQFVERGYTSEPGFRLRFWWVEE